MREGYVNCDSCTVVCVVCVCMLRECDGDSNDGVGDEGGVIVVSAWHEYVCGIRGSGIVSSAADLLEMSMVCWMRGVDGVCEVCMCLARSGVRSEGVSG